MTSMENNWKFAVCMPCVYVCVRGKGISELIFYLISLIVSVSLCSHEAKQWNAESSKSMHQKQIHWHFFINSFPLNIIITHLFTSRVFVQSIQLQMQTALESWALPFQHDITHILLQGIGLILVQCNVARQ